MGSSEPHRNAQTIPDLFYHQAHRFHRNPLFWTKRAGHYVPISWIQALELVQALSAYLLELPVNQEDRVIILSENRPEWGVADLAIQTIGAWTVPLYPNLTERDILHIVNDCRPVACIASNAEQTKKLRAVQQHPSSLRHLIILDPVIVNADPREDSWIQAIGRGRELLGRYRELIEHRRQQLIPEGTATIIYTSGTTGEPKGVLLSHRNFLSNAAACLRVIPIHRRDHHLSFLPLSHVFERMAGWYLMMMAGASVAYAENMDTVPQNMVEVRPSVMLGVPRFFEKLYARVHEGLGRLPPAKRRLAAWALEIGKRVSSSRLAHRPIPPGLRLCSLVAERLVFQNLKQRLGGRLRFFVSGSAPLSKTIGEFFHSVGVVILEGYGLTETSPVIAVNRPDALKFGTVGLPLDGVEVRIADDGEILTRGPHIMQGYYGKPEETQAVIIDGWLHTGDIGCLDAQGFLSITDRKKDLIKTAGGKFIAPQKLENRFITDPYVAQAFVYGDRERYCVALIVPHLQKLAEYARNQGLSFNAEQKLIQLPEIQTFMWNRIQALQGDFASFEQVKAIALLSEEFSQAAGELTPTLKAKRAAIATRYQETLHRLYLPTTSSLAQRGDVVREGK